MFLRNTFLTKEQRFYENHPSKQDMQYCSKFSESSQSTVVPYCHVKPQVWLIIRGFTFHSDIDIAKRMFLGQMKLHIISSWYWHQLALNTDDIICQYNIRYEPPQKQNVVSALRSLCFRNLWLKNNRIQGVPDSNIDLNPITIGTLGTQEEWQVGAWWGMAVRLWEARLAMCGMWPVRTGPRGRLGSLQGQRWAQMED